MIGLCGLGAAGLTVADTACSLIVDTNSNQCTPATVTLDCGGFPSLRTCTENVCAVVTAPPACTVTSDCSPSAGATCVAGACVRSCTADGDCGPGGKCSAGTCGAPPASGCQVNADCAGKGLGAYAICRKDNQTCQSLTSAECTRVYGKYQNDDAFIFGSVLPTTGPDATTGLPIEQSIEMAIDDFTQSSNGLPPAIGATQNRPLVVVSCSDDSDTATAEHAAQHLVTDVGVQAIIGSAFSGITIDVATTVTDAAPVLLFSPSATSDALTSLLDKGFVWRTSPPDTLQASALNLYLQVVIGKLSPAPAKPLVAIFNKGDAYGTGLATAVEANIAKAPNDIGTSQLVAVNYGNPDVPDAGTSYDAVIADTLGKGFYPHVVFILGTTEGVEKVLEPYEAAWAKLSPAPGYKPQYVFSDGGEVSEVSAYLAPGGGAPADLRTRISGSAPGAIGPVYTAFLGEFASTYPSAPKSAPATFGAAGGYDIVYLLAYSAAGVSSQVGQTALPLTAPNLIKGFQRLVPTTTGPKATPIAAGGDNNINMAFSVLTQTAGNIDYTGASGPLDFNIVSGMTGQAPSDIQIWCPQADTTLVDSGLYYDPLDPAALAGAFGAQCN